MSDRADERLRVAISGTSPAQRGFTYLWVLLAIGLVAAGLAATAEVASTAARRDKEAELLFAGDQFARAIARYRAAVPGSQQYPQRLENLLADNRFPNVRRHLRRIYRDPMTGGAEWGLVRGPNGGIVGVYSTSTAPPIKTANFPKEYAAFAGATSYRDWVFAPSGGAAGAPAGATPGGGAAGAPAGATPGGSPLTTTPSVPGAPGGTAPTPQGPAVRMPQ